MSQSRNDEDDRAPELGPTGAALTRMVQGGRSWSGKERNCCYLNTGGSPQGGGRFANVSSTTGIDFPDDARAMIPVDWDHDGDLDLWISNRSAPRLRFLRNESSRNYHFLALRLVGNAETTNRDAIGARVEVVTDSSSPLRQVSTLHAGHGFLAQGSKWLHFGLGDADRIEKVIVHWPAGETEEFTPFELDSRYVLVQGTGRAERLEETARSLALRPSTPSVPVATDESRTLLQAPIELIALPYETFGGSLEYLAPEFGRAKLITLWASWCTPCLGELQELSARDAEIDAAGLEVIALAINGVGEDESDPQEAQRMARNMEFPFRTARASGSLLHVLQLYHDLVTPMRRPLPLPSSFLVDGDGKLIAIYKGPLSLDQVLADLTEHRRLSAIADADERRLARFAAAAALPGRAVDNEVVLEELETAEVENLFQFADMMRDLDSWTVAENHYKRILELRPDSVQAHTHYAGVLILLGRDEDARQHLDEAIRLQPDSAEAYLVLGNLYLNRRDLPRAQVNYEHANRLLPDTADILNNLGLALRDQGKLAEAVSCFRQATELQPEFALAQFNLGTCYELQEKWEEAAAQYSHVQEMAKEQNLSDLESRCRRLKAEALEHVQASAS